MLLVQLLVNGLIMGSIYGLVALGFALIHDTTRILHLAHGAVYTVSAYVLYTFYVTLHCNIFISLILATISGTILGIIMEVFIYYPLYKKKAPSDVTLITSLGIYILVVNFIAMIYDSEVKVLRPGIEKTYNFGGVIFTHIQFFMFLTFIVLLFAFSLFLRKSKQGKVIRAISNNPELSQVVGIDIKKARILVFGIGSAFAGVVASFVALDMGITPWSGLPVLLTGIVAVIISGAPSFEGVILGAFLLAIVQSLAVWKISANWNDVITFGILIFFLLARPQGILGTRKRVEEL